MSGNVILWQVLAAYAFALVGGGVSASLRLSHQALCALISLAAGTLFGVTLFVILPETAEIGPAWMIGLAAGTGYS